MIKKIKLFKKSILDSTPKKAGVRNKKPSKTQVKSTSLKSKTVKNKTDKRQHKVLMFGWELPPFNSGGLGVACYELAESLSGKNTKITFILPTKHDIKIPFMDVDFAVDNHSNKSNHFSSKSVSVQSIDSPLSPYLNEKSYFETIKNHGNKGNSNQIYGDTLVDEVYRYGESAAKIAETKEFDVIHAHDWLSFPAGIKAKKVSHKPLIVHVHALEYDRSHEFGVNPQVCAIEKAGMDNADKVIAVSAYTKSRIIKFYGIPEDKIEVVHNGIKFSHKPTKKLSLKSIKSGGKKMVLFVGRITYQKGVDYLISAAYKALQINPKIIFMIVGSGDMTYQIIEQAAHFGISDKVFFPGFLRGDDLENIYRSADLYVMPSVSEPFGLVALEALSNKVPVIVSKQSGAAEVIRHSLKVDFWDTDELANKIIAVINNPSLRESLSRYGHKEVFDCTWDNAADKCIALYNKLSIASSI